MAAWFDAIHRLAIQVRVEGPPPDHQLEISRAQELLKENSWATRQSSWHRRGLARNLRSGDFPLPYLGEGPITCPGDLESHERRVFVRAVLRTPFCPLQCSDTR